MSSLSTPDTPTPLSTAEAAANARRSASAASHAAAVKRRERAAQWHLLFLAVVVLGPLVIYPLVRLVMLSLTGAHGLSVQAYSTFFGNPETRGVIGTTLWILFASAGLASLLGVALASILFFKPFPGARLVTRFLELFVAFPSFLVAFTLIFLYGSQGSVSIGLQRLFNLQAPPLDFLFGIGGVILAEVVFYAPFVVRPTLASFAMLDRRLIEAARSLGANGVMVAFKVILPLAWPGIAAGTILCFLLTLNEFGILLVLGSAHLITLPVAIYSSATVDLDLPTAAAGAVVMLMMSLSLYALYRQVNRRKVKERAMAVELDPTVLPVMHKKARPVRHSLLVRMLGGLFLGFAALLCFWLFVLPVLVVALSSVASHWSGTILPDGFSMRWFERLGSSDFDALTTSLEVGMGVAVLGTILGLWLALALEGRDRRGLGAIVDTIAMMPNGVPSVVLGLAVLIAYHKRPIDLSSSAAIVVFVQLALVLPFCYRCAAAALRPELTILREAAASLGAPPSMVLRRVVLPQLVPAIRASLALGFALSLGELGATLTVYPPGFATVPIVVVGQVERGYYLPASALSLILLLVSLAALLLIAARVPRRRVD